MYVTLARPWLLLCKPVRAPFRDGTSVLVRNMLRAMPSAVELVYLGDPDAPVRAAGDRVLSAASMHYQPSTVDKLRILARTLAPAQARLPIHSFFAANANSSRALELLRRLPGRPAVIQTLPATTGAEAVSGLLARLDRVVVTSDWGRRRLVDAGLDAERVVRIYPGVQLPEPEPEPWAPLSERRSILFAGDLDPEVGERLLTLARELDAGPWCLEIATRPKGEAHAAVLRRLQTELGAAIDAGRVRVHGVVERMSELYDRAAIQLYLASHARKKVDIPFVLLEGMARGVPVAIIEAEPVSELLCVAAQAQLDVGLSLAPEPRAFAGSVSELLARLADPARLTSMGAAARELVARHFCATEMAASYRNLYTTPT